jgi:hypothetical protein
MSHSLVLTSLAGVLFAGPMDLAFGQLNAPVPHGPARVGLAEAPIKSCRPVGSQSLIRQSQAIAETPPPAPEAAETVPETPIETVPGMIVPAPQFEGGIHPYYVTSAEDSHYFSECRHCGRAHCRCTYAPLGASLIAAFGRQAYLGSVEMMTLFDYDFSHSALTVRGIHQLQKCVRRMEVTPGPIKIEATWNPAVDAARREHVVEMLTAWGVPEAGGLVITVRTERGREAIESLETSEGLLQQIRARGRTIRPEDSATFSGTAIFGR